MNKLKWISGIQYNKYVLVCTVHRVPEIVYVNQIIKLFFCDIIEEEVKITTKSS